MIKTQKLIKYCAIVFAIFLVFNIILGIMYGVNSISNIFDDNESNVGNLKDLNINSNVQVLNVDVSSVNITVKEGNKFKVETNNKNINYKIDNNKLFITETKYNWFNRKDSSDLIIYVPSHLTFDNVILENGAGKINIDELYTKRLYLDLGAGKVKVNNLTVLNDTEIDGGAGEINITNSKINDLDLDMGIGKLSLTSKIIGDSEIDAGVGELNLNLIGSLNDYKIKLDKGIGSASINSEKMRSETYYGTGSNLIDIDGGVGSINIDFVN
ncbi:MAG: DUF4097 family beta strand repeat protein [Bacilli bacterium]|nr:DUF4097 family beta strand repeat protein [Bacilli bacterium]